MNKFLLALLLGGALSCTYLQAMKRSYEEDRSEKPERDPKRARSEDDSTLAQSVALILAHMEELDAVTSSSASHTAEASTVPGDTRDTEQPYPCGDPISTPAILPQGADLVEYEQNRNPAGGFFTCSHCDFTAKTKQHLTVHEAYKHSVERPFKCDKCDYAAKMNRDLIRHKIYKHSAERPFKCDKCDYAAKTKKNLINHQGRMHSAEKPFACNECSYTAKTKENLRSHQRHKHSFEKPYKCDKCSYAAKIKGNLKRHKKRMHQKIV
jgi:C2H2-type zinc-finger domain/Zinc finger, C2H2 type